MIANAPASQGKSIRDLDRSLRLNEWPEPDRRAWESACRPGARLRPGGSASHLSQTSRHDFAQRYGAFLGFLQRTDRLCPRSAPAGLVTAENVDAYIAELTTRVRSTTVWNCIYKLRRAAELTAPGTDFSWLAEIEKDLALVMEPRSKYDRLVLTERLLEAGLTLVAEAQGFTRNDLARARGVRNGFMVALLALCSIRLRNFAALEIGKTFREVQGTCWIALPGITTKSRRPDERAIPTFLNPAIDAAGVRTARSTEPAGKPTPERSRRSEPCPRGPHLLPACACKRREEGHDLPGSLFATWTIQNHDFREYVAQPTVSSTPDRLRSRPCPRRSSSPLHPSSTGPRLRFGCRS